MSFGTNIKSKYWQHLTPHPPHHHPHIHKISSVHSKSITTSKAHICMTSITAPDKTSNNSDIFYLSNNSDIFYLSNNSDIFLFIHENICCGYSLVAM